MRDLVRAEATALLTDTESVVRQTLLASNIAKLCAFFGPHRGSCAGVLVACWSVF